MKDKTFRYLLLLMLGSIAFIYTEQLAWKIQAGIEKKADLELFDKIEEILMFHKD